MLNLFSLSRELLVTVESWANTSTPHTLAGGGGDLSLYRPYRLGVHVIQYEHIYNSIYLTVTILLVTFVSFFNPHG